MRRILGCTSHVWGVIQYQIWTTFRFQRCYLILVQHVFLNDLWLIPLMASRMNGISRIYSCRSLLFQTNIIFFILLSLTRRWTVLLWAIGSCVLFEILRAILSYDNVFLSTHRYILLITFFINRGIIRSCRLQSFLKTRWYTLSIDVLDSVWYIWIAKVMHLLRHN